MMEDKLENLDLELKLKLHAIRRLHQELAKEQCQRSVWENLRSTASRLVARGNDKALRIVDEIDTKLEKVSARADDISLRLTDHGDRVNYLRLILGGQTTFTKVQLVVQARAFVSGLQDGELRAGSEVIQ